jgi:16S rRNA (uracil1498-N3)-methyltransferase
LTANRFFIKQKSIQQQTITLSGEEHHHLSRVSRARPGEKVWLFDGEGTNYLARIKAIGKNRTELLILEKMDKDKPKILITLAQALIKPKKFELIIQKSTELGVNAIIPVITARSVINIEGKMERKVERWRRIAREAAKQSRNSFVPTLSLPVAVDKLIKERDDAKKLFLSESKGKYLRDILVCASKKGFQVEEPPSSVLILIGPEGGWTKEEEEDILNHGFEATSLGKLILRAETAAICSLSLVSHFWNL